MAKQSQKKGSPYGIHRVADTEKVLPQPAVHLDNDFTEIYDNEILIDVDFMNIDAASFAEIKDRAHGDIDKMSEIMMDIVSKYGKHKNPNTGSGGMFMGRVAEIGGSLKPKIDLEKGDRIASLVSLSLTPLRIDEIKKIHMDQDQVEIMGQAILFESAIWAKLPDDIPDTLSLAILDVAGAPAQTNRLVSQGDYVAVLGAGGKSGLLCCYQAKKRAGKKGRVIGLVHSEESRELLESAPFVDRVVVGNADEALDLLEKMNEATGNKLCDVTISCVSRPGCEMGAILITREGGRVYFFSMATNFTKAALGAEGIGRDVEMIIGNGYCRGHAELALDIMRTSRFLRNHYESRYTL